MAKRLFSLSWALGFVFLFLSSVTAFGQGSESFNNLSSSGSYANRTWTGDNGLTWTAENSRTDESIAGSTGRTVTPRNTGSPSIECVGIPGGIGNLTFKVQQKYSGSGGVLTVYVNNISRGTFNVSTSVQTATFNNINVSGTFTLRIESNGNVRPAIDDVSWTGYSASAPEANVKQGTTNIADNSGTYSFGTTNIGTPSTQIFTIENTGTAALTLGTVSSNNTEFTVTQPLSSSVAAGGTTTFTVTHDPTANGSASATISFSNNDADENPYNFTVSGTGATPLPACTTPAAATNLVLTPVSTSRIDVSWTGSGADSYTLIISTNSTPPTLTDGTTFPGNGTYTPIFNGAGTSFPATSLNPNTTYYFYVFANNNACNGAPFYASALSGNATTNALPTTVQFVSASSSVTEGTASTTLTVSISNPSSSNATSATVSLPSGNARVSGFTSQTLNWAAGDNANKTITLTVTDNTACDGNQDLAFSLGSVSGGTAASAGAQNGFTLTVNDDDGVNQTIVNEDAEDNSISDWAFSSDWQTSTTGAINGSRSVRRSASGAGSGSLSYQYPSGFDLNAGDMTWEFTLKKFFPTSSSNKFAYFLVSTQGQLTTSTVDGYAVGVNQNSSDDRLYLYSVTNDVYTTIISTTLDVENDNNGFAIRVTRTTAGEWELFFNSDPNFTSMTSQGTVTSNIAYNPAYFGLGSSWTSAYDTDLYIDDILTTQIGCSTPVPTITTNVTSLSFGNVTVGNNSDLTYTVEGTDLTDPIVITAPNGYQVSTNGVNFFNNLSLTPTAGAVNTTTITVRFTPTSAVTNYSLNPITNTSVGATQVDVDLSGNGVNLCTTPANQATNLVLTPSAASVAGSFTAAVGGADGYLVLRSTSPTLSTGPVDGVAYNAGDNLGGGIVVSSAVGTTFNAIGLTTTTTYYFFVYAYNNTNCAGGPLYKKPLLGGNATTLASPFVAFDNFDRVDNNTVGIPSSGGATAWGENETGGSDEVEIYNNRLDINSYSSDASAWAHFDMTSRYSTTFDNATSELVWMFNMGNTRYDPSGFGANNNYGVAVVIGADGTDFRNSANGYAVILGESGSVDQLRLVYFTGGLVGGTWTNIIADGGDWGDELLAVKVTYNPATSQWSLGTYDGGSTMPFVDPTSVTYTNTLTATNQTYTALDLKYMGPFWNMSCNCGEYASFDNFNIPTAQACTNNTWTGAANTNWFNPANWSCGVVPTATDDVVITNVPSTNFPLIDAGLSTTAAVRNLTISAGASVTVTANVIGGFPQSTNDLEIYGNLTNNGNANWGTGTVTFTGSAAQTISGNNNFQYLTIDNAAGVTLTGGSNTQKVYGTLALKAGTLNTNSRLTIGSNATYTGLIDEFSAGYTGGINGSITVERYANNTASSFFYIGAPVGGAIIAGWADNFSVAPINGATDGSQVIPTANCSPTALQAGSPYGGLFDYRENAINTCNLEGWHVRTTGSILPGQGFIARVAAGTTIDLAGSFVTGQTVTGPTLTRSVNASGRPPGMNLVANPFAAPIDWQAVASANSGSVAGTAYFFQTSGPLAGTYVPVNNVLGGQEIGSSQAFIVEALSNGVTMNFTDNMKRNGANQYLRTGATYDQLLTLDVNGNGFADRMHVAFGGDFTTAFDNEFDARKLMSKPEQPSMYVNDGSLLYSIYAQPSVNAVQIVPVDFVAGTNGTFTIDADLNAFDPTALVFLEDRLLGTMTNLRMVTSYSFSATVNDAANRFALHFFPGMEVVTEDASCAGVDGNITFNQPGATEWQLALIDANGNVVYTDNAFNGNFTVSNLAPDIYTLNLVHASGYTVSKLYLLNGPAPIVANFTAPATATEGDDVTFTNSAVNATSYLWSFGDGTTSTDANPTHVYAYAGEYLVELLVSNGTCQESITQLVTIEAKLANGIDDVLSGKVKIYAYGTDINIVLTNMENFSSVEVFDLMGRVVVGDTRLEFVNGTFVINMEDAANGYYFVRLHNGQDIKIEKVFVNSVK